MHVKGWSGTGVSATVPGLMVRDAKFADLEIRRPQNGVIPRQDFSRNTTVLPTQSLVQRVVKSYYWLRCRLHRYQL